MGEDLVFDVAGGDFMVYRHFKQVDDFVRFGAKQGYAENFAAFAVHNRFEQAIGLPQNFGFGDGFSFQFQHLIAAPRLRGDGFG